MGDVNLEQYDPEQPVMVVIGVLPMNEDSVCLKCRVTIKVMDVMDLVMMVDGRDWIEFAKHERFDFLLPELFETPYQLMKIEIVQAMLVGEMLQYRVIFESEVDTEIPFGAPTLITYQRELIKFEDEDLK